MTDNPHLPSIEDMATPGVPINYWHVYQDDNGLWSVVSEGEDGKLAFAAINVPTRHEAVHHEARKMMEATGEGEILVEQAHVPAADADDIQPHSMKLRRVWKSKSRKRVFK